MKRYWIIVLAVVLAACGGGGQKGNFSDPTDRLEVVSWWVSPSEHPAFEVLLNAFKAANPDVESRRRRHRRRRRQQCPGRARRAPAGRRSARRLADVPGKLASCVGRRRPHRRCVRRLRKLGSGSNDAAGVARRGDLSRQSLGRADRVPSRKCVVVQPADAARRRREGARARLHDRGFRSGSGEGGGKRQDRVVPRRQGQVHRDRTVREHTARRDRHRRVGQDSGRFVRLAGISTQASAFAVRQDRLSRRSERRRSDVGSGGEEAGHRSVRLPVDERFRLRRTRREQGRSKARTSGTCRIPGPRVRTWRSSTRSWCRPMPRTA